MKTSIPALSVRPIFQELGSPLLLPESFDPSSRSLALELPEGSIIDLVDGRDKGRFVARAYLGRQNKGVGWVLTANPKEAIDTTFFHKKLRSALEKRLTILKNPKTTAFRVFNGEGDGIGGLTIDYYDESYLITYYSEGIACYHDQILRELLRLTAPRTVIRKLRFGEHDPSGELVTGSPDEAPRQILENGVSLCVDLLDGAMTGIFLDQRDVRRALRNRYAKGRRVLNLFSYSGAFSVFAAKGGASTTLSVDAAPRSIALTEANFAANRLPFGDGTPNTILIADVFDYLEQAAKSLAAKFDLIVLDPPSFSTVHGRVFRSEKDYAGLAAQCARLLSKNGILVLSTNNAQIPLDKFEKKIAEGIGSHRVLERFGLPQDFRTHSKYKEGEYLKVWMVQPDV